jgi:hypothetical protein
VSEEPKTLKVAICIPSYGDPKFKFVHSFTNMLIYSLSHATINDREGRPRLLEIDTFMVSCSMLTESRHTLVAAAIDWEADYMLCLDADHVFPHDTLMRLLAHGLPVVGCNYARRVTPTAPTAAMDSGDEDSTRHLLYTTQEKADEGLVEQCEHLGFGVLLIDMRVFDALWDHAKKHGDGNPLPLFKFEPTANKIGMIGEDVFFFKKLAEAGIKPFIDHSLSWQVGHCYEVILTNAHACVQKEAWREKKQAERERRNKRVREVEARVETEMVDGK